MSVSRSNAALPSIDQWIGALSTKSVSTKECYARDVRQIAVAVGLDLARTCEIGDILDLDTTRLGTIIMKWDEAGEAPATIRRRLVSLRRYARFMAAEFKLSGPLLSSDFPIVDVALGDPVPEDHL